MTVAISMTAWHRPKYLQHTLDSLRMTINNASKVFEDELVLVPNVEFPLNNEVCDIIKNIDFIEVFPEFNKENLGLNGNVFRAIDRGFTYSDKVIHLDDDADMGADWLIYNLRMLDIYEQDKEIMYITAYTNKVSPIEDREYYLVYRANHLGSIGFSLWKDRWPWFASRWNKTERGRAWDSHILEQFESHHYGIFPVISRVRHVGRENGTYMSAAVWDSWITGQKWSQDKIVLNWTEVTGQIKEHGRFYEDNISNNSVC